MDTTFYLVGNPRIVGSIVLKLRSRRFSTTCWWQSIWGRCLFSASLIYQLPSILWTTTCCCNDASVSSACVAECSSGFVHNCQAGHSVLCTATWCRSLSVSDVCLKRICSLDTRAFSALEVLGDYCTI